MATLIAVYNSEGCVGRCDARCYDATGGDCTCVCGGANHGAGLERACEHVRAYADEMIENFCAQLPPGEYSAAVNASVMQMNLFSLVEGATNELP